MRALSMFARLHFLRHCRLSPLFSSCTFKEFKNLSQTSWSSLKVLKQREFRSYFLRPSVHDFSSQPRPSEDDIKLNKVILSLKTVKEQLELFGSIKSSASIVNRVTMLHSIAKITGRDGNQRRVLEQEKGKSRQAFNSAYLALLDSISKDIAKCKPWDLANVIWALGKVQEKDHELVQVCERVILSRDITAFDKVNITQIANGCINLDLTATEISFTLQESIRNGQLKIANFDNQLLSSMLMLFAKSDGCAVELFDIFLKEILSRDFLLMSSSDLALFVWSFAKKELKADTLFDKVEEEILRRGTANLKRRDIFQILWAFGMSKKGGKQLFNTLDNDIVVKGKEGFNNAELLQIVGSFARRNITKAQVFDVVKDEVFNRGVGKFQFHELVLILHSFVSARRHDNKLVNEIECELQSRDAKQFCNGHLSQVAWSLGRARKSDSKMLNVIEAEVFKRGLHQFSRVQKFMLLRGYIEAKRGSRKFYESLQSSLLTNDFSDLTARDIYDFAWCFSEAGVNTGPLFDALEKEILNKGNDIFSNMQLSSIKKSFQKVGKGTKELFKL
ncbi:uncharacterized protein LOC110045705 [Orbicella faveolata]|uniref:uncharacterized protein LOC110045705 n=1 Tax=Orbicella faveolata TaxID=48498 RepID=UPI0009E1A897|nr:uncharacterized protein LOC110045705 [Orbicella faveolata]